MPKDFHSPAFQIYPNEWLGSTKIMLMTPAEEGAYFRLLCIEWNSRDCSLPDDDKQLSVLSRLDQEWFNGSGIKIRQNFVSRRGKIFNKRLLKEREKQEEWREKCREGGIKSGKSRRNKENIDEGLLKGSSTKDLTKGEVNTNISSSSSSSSSISSLKNKSTKNLFILPTLEEVSNYCHERQSSVDPQKWMDHYISNGWMVGKNKMKDWKAAVRTWEGNAIGQKKNSLDVLKEYDRKYREVKKNDT